MRFLANENFPGGAVSRLRDLANDVAWICTDSPGATDKQVLARAVEESRILLTFDKDFGELAFRSALPATCGIILFRIPMANPECGIKTIIDTLQSRNDWAGNFAVVEERRLRLRLLPNSV
ncbi:MAG: DUF5615 family PIN-like protein [Candidatus Riflebacteria bacterium]|nr:DUF5615 family PIN-like protein [Candidatus Riflebacteria bacterium]